MIKLATSGSYKKGHTGYWLGKKRPRFSEATRKKMSISHEGEKSYLWKGGLCNDPKYVSWIKNRRNRLKRISTGSHTFGEFQELKNKYNFTCPSCLKSEPEIKLTEDHIVPLSKGGSDSIENIQPLCSICNVRKSAKIIKYEISYAN